jgi:hypothetical protein
MIAYRYRSRCATRSLIRTYVVDPHAREAQTRGRQIAPHLLLATSATDGFERGEASASTSLAARWRAVARHARDACDRSARAALAAATATRVVECDAGAFSPGHHSHRGTRAVHQMA